MDKLYKYISPFPNRFSTFLENNGCQLDNEWQALTNRLGVLPPTWYWQMARMLDGKTINQAGAFLAPILHLIDELADIGLGTNPPWKNICAAFKHNRRNFFSRHDFCTHAYRLIERIGRYLLINRLEQSGVTHHVRLLIQQHRKNGAEMINFGRRMSGYKTAQKQAEERSAERQCRISGNRDYYMRDCRYVAINWTITAPSCFNPGYGSDHNPSWIDAGCPSPRDAHDWINAKYRAIVDQANKAGFPVNGWRTVESHKNGTTHWNGRFYASKDDADSLMSLMFRILPCEPENRIGGPRKSRKDRNQALVANITDDYDSAARWDNYVDKNCSGHDNDDDDEFDSSVDEDYAFLWGHNQSQFFGQQPIKYWRIFKRLDRRQFDDESDESVRAQLPKPILDAWAAATGKEVSGFDYRAFLRLTESDASTHKKIDSSGVSVLVPTLSFQTAKVSDLESIISFSAARSDTVVETCIRKTLSDEISIPDEKIFDSIYGYTSFLQLRIKLPTASAEPPPRKPFKFTFRHPLRPATLH